MPTAYPGADDLTSFLEAAGFQDAAGGDFAGLDLPTKVQAAVEEWEQATQWLPFLSPGVVQTRTYDPPGPPARRGTGFSALRGGGTRLFLEAGLLSVPVVTVAGSLYGAGFQYLVRPDNAAMKGKPSTWIEFLVPVLARAGDIAVSGVWGYSLTCPAQAWTAILAKAAALCVPQLAAAISRGLIERKAGDEMEKYSAAGVTPLSAELRMWEAQFGRAAGDLGRVELF